MRDWQQQIRLTIARLRVEHPALAAPPAFPRFRATFFLLWIVSLAGLSYGRFFDRGEAAQTVSLILTGASWLTSVFILLLRDPLTRISLLIGQIITLIFATFLLPVGLIAYSIILRSTTIVISIKLAWIAAAILLAYVTIQLLVRTFILPFFTTRRYPGMFSCPVLFGIFVVNYIWWNWSALMSWIR